MAPQRESFLAALKYLVVKMDGGKDAAFARRIGVCKSTLFHTLKGIGTPTLKLSLNIASQCNIPLVKLLAGDISEWQPPSTAQLPLLPPEVRPKRAPAREIDWLQVEAAMQRFLRFPTPISVHEAARRLDMDKRQLYLRVNRLARELSARWREYTSRQHQTYVVNAWPYIEAACVEAMKEGNRSVKRADVEARLPPDLLSKFPHLYSVITLIKSRL